MAGESGTLQNAGTIDWTQCQLYNTASTGPNDLAPDFYVNGMTLTSVPEPSSLALLGLASADLLLMRRRE